MPAVPKPGARSRRSSSLAPMPPAPDPSNGSPSDESGLPRLAEMPLAERLRKGTAAGNALAALYRMRRLPSGALAARRAARGDPPTRREGGRPRYRGVYVIPAGPGDWEPLRDTLASVLAYEGTDAKVIVVDDATVDCRAAAVQAELPEVDVVRRRVPSGGPPRNTPVVLAGLRHARANYDFEVAIKMDTDALVTAASPSAVAASYFAEQPRVGLAGTYLTRADGLPEEYEFDAWVLRQTERWSPAARRMMARARAGGYRGAKVHGGVYAVSGAAVEALATSGDLSWREPFWTPLGEDFWLSMLVLANGFELGSLGGPGEAFAVASKYTPIAKEQVLSEPRVAIHSVRRGADGEDEATLRAFFRAAREGGGGPQARASEGSTEASGPPSS